MSPVLDREQCLLREQARELFYLIQGIMGRYHGPNGSYLMVIIGFYEEAMKVFSGDGLDIPEKSLATLNEHVSCGVSGPYTNNSQI
jgi:hypothetical protein